MDALLRQGTIRDYAALARLGHVSRARVTQILNLLCLAPDIQEEILFLPSTVRGRDSMALRQLQPIAQTLDWRQQRGLWRQLTVDHYPRFLTELPGDSWRTEVTDWEAGPANALDVRGHRNGLKNSSTAASSGKEHHGPV
jgi:hypothetical protein